MNRWCKYIVIVLIISLICTGCGNGDEVRKVKNKNSVDVVIQNEIDKSNEKASASDVSEDTEEETSKENITEEDKTEQVSEDTEENNSQEDTTEAKIQTDSIDPEVDIDISVMNSDMIYATVYQLVSAPEQYIGKRIKIKGNHYSQYYEETGLTYHFALIQDAAACCAQGLEFEMASGLEYPNEEEEVVVVGTFETYEEQGLTYCTLKNSVIQ